MRGFQVAKFTSSTYLTMIKTLLIFSFLIEHSFVKQGYMNSQWDAGQHRAVNHYCHLYQGEKKTKTTNPLNPPSNNFPQNIKSKPSVFSYCNLLFKIHYLTNFVGSAPLKQAFTDSVRATATGKVSWFPRLTGLGPPETPRIHTVYRFNFHKP